MHRVLIPPDAIHGSSILVTDPCELHHLRDVLRVTVGSVLECVDGQGRRYRGVISRMGRASLHVDIREAFEETAASAQVVLAHAVMKADRFEWMLQKATELGVARVIPLVTARTIVRPSADRTGARLLRWQRIVAEAAKQCGRSILPPIDAPQAFGSFAPGIARYPLALMPTLAVPGMPLREFGERIGQTASSMVLIGPEGDFTQEEVRLAQHHGAQPVSLGTLTLRSETAAVAVLAVVRLAFGRYNRTPS